MSIGNAWKYHPARQAKLLADEASPEYLRHRDMYRKARGPIEKQLVAFWNREWNRAGRPANFLDYPEWKKTDTAKAHREYLKKLSAPIAVERRAAE